MFLGFQKHIIHWGYLHFGKWPQMTSNDLKWPRIRKISIQADFSRSQDSENIPYVKSQNFQSSSPFLRKRAKSTRNDPNPAKSSKTSIMGQKQLCVTIFYNINNYIWFLIFLWIPSNPTTQLLSFHTTAGSKEDH